MQIKLNLFFRRFNSDESADSGYCSAIDGKKSCRIDINLNDPPFEQVLTIYHEITHFVFDLFTQYQIDNDKQKVIKRDNTLRDKWRIYNNKTKKNKNCQYKEELICCKVERVVRTVLQKQIPKTFLKELFTNKKLKRKIKRERK